MSVDIGPTVRIARGELTEDALAALTSVLMALTRPGQDTPTPSTGWRRLNWHNGYHSPLSWHELPGGARAGQ
jgi:hypothetical protein